MLAIEDRPLRFLPLAASVGLHAVTVALVIGAVLHRAPPAPPTGITVTVDALSTAIAPSVAGAAGVPEVAARAPPAALAEAAVSTTQDAAPVAVASAEAIATPEAERAPTAVASRPMEPGRPGSETLPQSIAAVGANTSLPAEAALEEAPRSAEPLPATSVGLQRTLEAETPTQGVALPAGAAAPTSREDGVAPAAPSSAVDVAQTLPSPAEADAMPAIEVLSRPLPVPQTASGSSASAALAIPASSAARAAVVSADAAPAVGQATVGGPPPAGLAAAGSPDAAAEHGAVLAAPTSVAPQVASADPVDGGEARSNPPGAMLAVPAPETPPSVSDFDAGRQPQPAPTSTASLGGVSAAAVSDFIAHYDGGPCFYASVTEVTASGVAIAVLSNDKPKFQRLNDAFLGRLGLDPAILGQRVTAAQCPAIDMMRRSKVDGMHLTVEHNRLRAGDVLTGAVLTTPGARPSLYLVSEQGRVTDVSRYAHEADGRTTFAVPIEDVGHGGSHPELLVAASDGAGGPVPNLSFDAGFDATRIAMAAALVVVGDQTPR